MKKVTSLLLASMVLAGCVQNGNSANVTDQDLQHHRFVLESVDGKPLANVRNAPEISFGEKMHVSGAMCNRFMGQGQLTNNTLKVEKLASTMKLCVEPQLNELDTMIKEMLSSGAKVEQTPQQLTLKTDNHTLVYKLADLVN